MQKIILNIFAWVILASIGAWIAGNHEKQHAYVQLKEELNYLVAVRKEILERQIERRRRDTRFLVKVPPVSGIVRASNSKQFDELEKSTLKSWKKRLETIFSAYASVNPEVRQVRYIGLADEGREIVRIDSRNGKIVTQDPLELQKKGKTNYFQKSLNLHPGEVFVSNLELNREQGEIEIPHWPTWRTVTPSFDEKNNLFGMIVINLDANFLLKIMETSLFNQYNIYLYDSTGEFVLHHDRSKMFLRDLGETFKWSDEFKIISAGKNFDDLTLYQTPFGKFYAASRILVLNPGSSDAHTLTLVITANESIVLTAVKKMQIVAFLIILLCGIIMSLINYLFIKQKLKLNLLLEKQVKERTHEIITLSSLQKAILTNASYAIIATDITGNVTLFNPAAEKMLGYSANEIIGKVTPLIWHDPKEINERAQKISEELKKPVNPGFNVFIEKSQAGLENKHQWTFIRKDGTRLIVMLSVTILYGIKREIMGYLGIASDITLQKQYEEALRIAKEKSDADREMLKIQSEKLREMAIHDGLTGLANRRHFDERLALAARQAKRTGLPLTIFMIDVDYFKKYNDYYGHQAGDKALQQLANIFKKHILRAGDLVARYGGEEFACLLSNMDQIGAKILVERLLQAVRNEHIVHADSSISSVVTISIGAAVAKLSKDDDVMELIKIADKLLYQAKHEGRDRAIIENVF